MERELVTFVPKNVAGAIGGLGVGAIAGKVAGAISSYRSARAVAGVVESSGGSINRAIAQSNSAGLSQGQAVQAISTVIESSGRGIGGVVEIGAGAVAIAARQPGVAQPIVIVGARGTAQMGSATTRFTLDAANQIVTTLSNILPK
jgi:hypothetical protein